MPPSTTLYFPVWRSKSPLEAFLSGFIRERIRIWAGNFKGLKRGGNIAAYKRTGSREGGNRQGKTKYWRRGSIGPKMVKEKLSQIPGKRETEKKTKAGSRRHNAAGDVSCYLFPFMVIDGCMNEICKGGNLRCLWHWGFLIFRTVHGILYLQMECT